jgi:hypothetical protein
MMSGSSYPPSPCRRCGTSDANWIVSALGCAHCFDPFAAAAEIALLRKVAESADELVGGRGSIEDLQKDVDQWKAKAASLEERRTRSIFPT